MVKTIATAVISGLITAWIVNRYMPRTTQPAVYA